MSTLMQNYNAYMSLDLSQYIGQWIAIFENAVIAHGKNAKEVYQKAMEITNGKKIMLTKVPSAQLEIL